MQILNYTMFGKPARVFPIPPNWASPVVESLEWKTDILKARNGLEQRRALRTTARRSFEYRALLKGRNTALFEALMWGWQHRHFALPVWTDTGYLLTDVAAGQVSLPLTTALLGFRADDFVIIYANADSYEVVEVQAVLSGSLTTKAVTVNAWPAGTKVFPLVLAHLSSSVSSSRHTSSLSELGNVLFSTSPDVTYDFIETGAATTLYDGIEVITHKPNWGAAIQNDFTREFDTVDAGVGPVGYYETETTSRMVRPFQWLLKTRAEIIEFRKLMGRLRGQAKTVWMPSWHDDFELAASNVADQTKLTVKGTAFHTLVGLDISRDRLAVRLPNGTTQYRRVTALAPNYLTDTTQLQLDSTLGSVINTTDSLSIHLLLRCRLASDKVVIPWLTDAVSAPQTTFTTVKL